MNKDTNEGWTIYVPWLDQKPPEGYREGDDWEFRFGSLGSWISPSENEAPQWSPWLQYRFRPAVGHLSGTAADVVVTDGLPDDNPKTAFGSLKTPTLSVVPASALLQMGEVMRLGRDKYGPFNWRDAPVSYSTYVDAAMRHLMQFWDGETVDPESGQSHLAHVAAGLSVLMDAIATGNAHDDRPTAGVAAELIDVFKKRREELKG